MGDNSLIRTGRLARALLPQRLVLHPDYFLVRRLNELAEAGKKAVYMTVLRERLRRVLMEAVAHVPHYKRGHISLDACRNEDPFALLGEFPFLTKDEVNSDQASFVSSRVPRMIRYEMSGSGSSGNGITMWRTKRLADIEKAFFDHEWCRWGWSSERSRILRIGDDSQRKIDEYPVRRQGNRLLASSFHLTPQWLPEIYDTAVKFAPEFIHAYSSAASELARFIVQSHRPRLGVRAVMLTSEPLLACDIPTLQAAFGPVISITYGHAERTNFAVATVLEGGTELCYRLNPVYGYQENYLHPNGCHEIVGTSYWNTVMPLIRYCTADFGKLCNGTIVSMEGRDLEYLVTKSGRRIPGAGPALPIDVSVWHSILRLQIYQPRRGEVVFRVVPREGCSQSDLDNVMALLGKRWQGFFDMSLAVVDEIPKTRAGKARLVVREASVQEGSA